MQKKKSPVLPIIAVVLAIVGIAASTQFRPMVGTPEEMAEMMAEKQKAKMAEASKARETEAKEKVSSDVSKTLAQATAKEKNEAEIKNRRAKMGEDEDEDVPVIFNDKQIEQPQQAPINDSAPSSQWFRDEAREIGKQ